MTETSANSCFPCLKTVPIVYNSKNKNFFIPLALIHHPQLQELKSTYMHGRISYKWGGRYEFERIRKGLRLESYLFMLLREWREEIGSLHAKITQELNDDAATWVREHGEERREIERSVYVSDFWPKPCMCV
jgi:hypothetical protein